MALVPQGTVSRKSLYGYGRQTKSHDECVIMAT